jgi:hypothetical protein
VWLKNLTKLRTPWQQSQHWHNVVMNRLLRYTLHCYCQDMNQNPTQTRCCTNVTNTVFISFIHKLTKLFSYVSLIHCTHMFQSLQWLSSGCAQHKYQKHKIIHTKFILKLPKIQYVTKAPSHLFRTFFKIWPCYVGMYRPQTSCNININSGTPWRWSQEWPKYVGANNKVRKCICAFIHER